jgi:sugar lactone lactonase YvrE
MIRLFLGLLLIFSLPAEPAPNAKEELTQLRQQARTSREKGDKQARLQAVLKVEKLLNDSPRAAESAALAYFEAGENDQALAELNKFADMGQADDDLLGGKDHSFAALEKLPQYQAILKRFAENKTAISRAETAFSLPDAGLVAEDMDYDRESKTFLITSVLEKKIVRVTMEGKASEFAASPSGWPMLAIKIDAARGLVWATEVALDNFSAAPKADWGRSAVLCFELRTGKLHGRIEGPAHSALGDMVLAADGDPIVSDGAGGGVYRVKGGQLERLDGGEFISPQTATMSPDGKQVMIPDYLRGIGVLDLTSRKVAWLSADGGREFAFDGIDGLYFDHGALFATQNGTSPERVIRFQLNSTLSGFVSEQVIERATDTLGDPTHGVIVGDYFYYIANSGWSELDDYGVLKAGGKLTAARIMRFRR